MGNGKSSNREEALRVAQEKGNPRKSVLKTTTTRPPAMREPEDRPGTVPPVEEDVDTAPTRQHDYADSETVVDENAGGEEQPEPEPEQQNGKRGRRR